jgi:hypothetical protein
VLEQPVRYMLPVPDKYKNKGTLKNYVFMRALVGQS